VQTVPTLHSEWRTVLSTCKVSSSSPRAVSRPGLQGSLYFQKRKGQVSLLTRDPGSLGQRQAFGEHRRIKTGTWLRSSFRDWIPKASETVISGSLVTSSARFQHRKVPRFCRINGHLENVFSLDALLSDGVAGGWRQMSNEKHSILQISNQRSKSNAFGAYLILNWLSNLDFGKSPLI
jgi:hypothetical protein